MKHPVLELKAPPDELIVGITPEVAAKYLAKLQKHVTNVIEAGEKLGVEHELLQKHDETKITLNEFPQYAKHWTVGKGETKSLEYKRAWLHHVNRNPHHWEHWIIPYGLDSGENEVLPMPKPYVLEMIADWLGSSKTYTNMWDITEWLAENVPRITLHADSAKYAEMVLTHKLHYGGLFKNLSFNIPKETISKAANKRMYIRMHTHV